MQVDIPLAYFDSPVTTKRVRFVESERVLSSADVGNPSAKQTDGVPFFFEITPAAMRDFRTYYYYWPPR